MTIAEDTNTRRAECVDRHHDEMSSRKTKFTASCMDGVPSVRINIIEKDQVTGITSGLGQ